MTHDEMIAVIEADRDGESVQYQQLKDPTQPGQWFDAQEGVDFVLPFDFLRHEYRVKPNPVERWAYIYDDGSCGGLYVSKSDALNQQVSSNARLARLVEVTE